MVRLFKKSGVWHGTIDTASGPVPLQTGCRDKYSAMRFLNKKQNFYNNAHFVEDARIQERLEYEQEQEE
jgi:hypothetical protein